MSEEKKPSQASGEKEAISNHEASKEQGTISNHEASIEQEANDTQDASDGQRASEAEPAGEKAAAGVPGNGDGNGKRNGMFPSPITPPRLHSTQIWKGIGLTALLHLIPIVFPLLYFGIGIVQLLYIIPAIIICRKNTGMVQGLLIGAGITFLLNAACYGIVIGSSGR